MYGSTIEVVVREVAQAFQRQSGIKVNYIRMSTGEALNRIRAERNNPQASVWFAGPGDSYLVAKQEGLLQPYISPVAARIAPQYRDPEGYWTGLFTSVLGFASNTKILAERKLPAPRSWADLLKPEFKGHVAVSNPATSGTAYTFLSTIVQLMGEEKGFGYLKKLHGNIAQYPKSGMGPGQMAGRGELIAGILMLQDAYLLQREGYPLELTTPDEGTGYSLEPVAILKGAPEPVEAKRFVDWILSREGQEVMQRHFHLLFFTNPDVKPRAEAAAYTGAKLISYDFLWAGANKNRLIEKFQNEVMAGK
jgi:iron(III) transport system substrate-binding protein